MGACAWHRNRELHGMGIHVSKHPCSRLGPPLLRYEHSTSTASSLLVLRRVSAHTDGSETHHLPVTLSGVAWVRRQGQVGPGPDDFAHLLRTELCAEDNTRAVSIQPPWRRGWGSPRKVAVYGMQAHQGARDSAEPLVRHINGTSR
ncbi:hypothetical protein V8C42DRAFT_303966 [Trichoderma barbatum]